MFQVDSWGAVMLSIFVLESMDLTFISLTTSWLLVMKKRYQNEKDDITRSFSHSFAQIHVVFHYTNFNIINLLLLLQPSGLHL